MADQKSLRFLGFAFSALTALVTLAAVVTTLTINIAP